MRSLTCTRCGATFPYAGHGRPRRYCYRCSLMHWTIPAAPRPERAPAPGPAPAPAADPQAERDARVHHYLPLVKHIANRLSVGLPAHVDLDDLVGWGALGLLDALEKFDPTRGVKFETYAFNRIRGAMVDGLRATDCVPAILRQRARLLEETRWTLASGLGRPATVDEVAKATGLRPAAVLATEAEADRAGTVSIDRVWGADTGAADEESFTLADLVADPSVPDPADLAVTADRDACVRAAVQRLPERERQAIVGYYWDGLAPKEIAAAMGLSSSRISQLLSKATRRLRGMLARQADRIRPLPKRRPIRTTRHPAA